MATTSRSSGEFSAAALAVLCLNLVTLPEASAQNWPQFHGPSRASRPGSAPRTPG